jgi:hypothetical protein
MERYELNPMSPAGQVEQWGDLASGLRHNPSGRRRAVRMLVVLVAVLILATELVLLLV